MASSSSISEDTQVALSKPHQPRNFNFPKQEFELRTKLASYISLLHGIFIQIERRSFQPSWFNRWSWLHYIEHNDTVLCYTCKKAHLEKKLQWSLNTDAAFVNRGFSNWKDACKK